MFPDPVRAITGPTEEGVVILPAPLASPVGLGNCTGGGPEAIMSALAQEDRTRKGVPEGGYPTAPALDFDGLDQAGAVELIRRTLGPRLDEGEFVLLLGGEHTVTLGAVWAHLDRGGRFGVVYLDAHADLKAGIGSFSLTHATVARRLVETGLDLAGLGWRSFDAREYEFWRRNYLPVLSGQEIMADPGRVKEIIEELPERVYLSLDLDVLDPALMPATGAPEPEGLSLEALNAIIDLVFGCRRVIGADVVELSPLPSRTGPEKTAARICRRLMELGASQGREKTSRAEVLPLFRSGFAEPAESFRSRP